MTDIAFRDLVFALGGREYYEALLVPVHRVNQFINAVEAAGCELEYAECLFLSERGTRPSMLLSAERRDFKSDDEFHRFLIEASLKAQTEADLESSQAYFEVGTTAAN